MTIGKFCFFGHKFSSLSVLMIVAYCDSLDGSTIKRLLSIKTIIQLTFPPFLCCVSKLIRLCVLHRCRGRMIPAELERLVKEAIEQKKRPFFVNCTCGTTVLGKHRDWSVTIS